MDSAKAAVKDFMAKSGHHDTTVHEKVAPAVIHETINRTEHETVQTAIDKEVHQDHYHTSIQPVEDVVQLKEQHHHNIVPVEHRSYEHDSPEQVKLRLEQEAAKFRDEQVRIEGQKTSSVAPIVAGEHIHHHVHETIQPIVNKQVIEPHVVHTTVPIHEVHHNAAQHHSTSALPAVSMADFKKQGGVLSGREERYDGFEGEPRSVGGAFGGNSASSMGASGLEGRATNLEGSNIHGSHHHHESGLGHSTTGSSGLGHSSSSGLGHSSSSGLGHSSSSGLGHSTGSSTLGSTTTGTGLGHHEHNSSSGLGHSSSNTSSSTHKPSMMDKLNPKVDSNGDGKAGFMK